MTDQQAQENNRTRFVLKSYGLAFLASLFYTLAGAVLGYFWITDYPGAFGTAKLVQIVSGLFFTWSVLGVCGFEIQSWGGLTGPEKLNKRLFKTLTGLGWLFLSISSFALYFSGQR